MEAPSCRSTIKFKAAAVQASHLSRLEATVAKTIDLIGAAARGGARLVAFPNAGSPATTVDPARLGRLGHAIRPALFRYDRERRRDAGHQAAAREHAIHVVFGYAERSRNGNLYGPGDH